YVVSLGLAFFAFSTILGWAYYGERAIEYLIGVSAIVPYRILFVIAAFFGAAALDMGASQVVGFQLVWNFSDVMNGAMAIPNLIGLLLLSGVVKRETQAYFSRREGSGAG
ncbi:MAG TPA: alanine:cation symporter family protein, partial [Nannocystis sp.]